jgi:hypothetical protein
VVLAVHGSGVSAEVAKLLVNLVNRDAGSALRASRVDGRAHAVLSPIDSSDPIRPVQLKRAVSSYEEKALQMLSE